MPYYEIDPETLEEYAEYMEGGEAPHQSGAFYEPAEAVVNLESGNALARTLRDALVAKGFSSVYCRYDGGFDEGFAYFGHATANGVPFDPQELAALLKDTPLADALVASYPEPYQVELRAEMAAASPEKQTLQALEDFADTMAAELLGQGYGTGDYSMRGQFTVDLLSGRIVDLEHEI